MAGAEGSAGSGGSDPLDGIVEAAGVGAEGWETEGPMKTLETCRMRALHTGQAPI